jgi:hypothetical protein
MLIAQMATSVELARWRRLQSTEATASQYASASGPRYRLAENIGFATVVPARVGVAVAACVWRIADLCRKSVIRHTQVDPSTKSKRR